MSAAKARMGRPPLDPEGCVELRIRVPKALASKVERVAMALMLRDVNERPLLAAAVRKMIEAYPEPD